MCQTRLMLQSYKKYLKYTTIIHKIHTHNEYLIKKSEKIALLALRKLNLMFLSNLWQRYKKYLKQMA